VSTQAATESLQAILREIPAAFPVERIDTIWLFAPREFGGREHGLVMLSVEDPEQHPEDGLLEIVTWEYHVEKEKKGSRRVDTVTRQGWAPRDRAARVAHGVLVRLRDETEALTEQAIGGDPERWAALLAEQGAASLDPPNEE
jgi:hypothetical protein